jgi:hypothetical protein
MVRDLRFLNSPRGNLPQNSALRRPCESRRHQLAEPDPNWSSPRTGRGWAFSRSTRADAIDPVNSGTAIGEILCAHRLKHPQGIRDKTRIVVP